MSIPQPPSKRLKMEEAAVELPSKQEIEDSIRNHLDNGEWKKKNDEWKDEQVEWTDEQVSQFAEELTTLHGKEKGNVLYMTKVLEGQLEYAQRKKDEDDQIAITIQLSVVKELVARQQVGSTPRVASLLTGMDIALSHDLDVEEFIDRIQEVAKWHETDHAKYAFPYFTLIQSSGMGKTRLLKETKEQLNLPKYPNRACRMIYCHDDSTALTDAESIQNVYDSTLNVAKLPSAAMELYPKLDDQLLNGCANTDSDGSDGILVLLFDEAQQLMKHDDSSQGSLFRKLRWWLRKESQQRVVAVFTGTSSKLSNYFPVTAPPNPGSSRDDKFTYHFYKKNMEAGKILYPPWFMLRTIGCLRRGLKNNNTPSQDPHQSQDQSEFERSSLFGRPLFAAMNSEGLLGTEKEGSQVENKSLFSITRRILLAREVNERMVDFDKAVVCSVVGSRVQMGVLTSFDVASQLVAGAYTCLVGFQQEGSACRARTCTMPDPICAGLAMGLMDEKWSVVSKESKASVGGIPKKKWVAEVEKVLSSGLCLPDKGDHGEIFAALYMLFCGDELRRKKDESLRTFSVSLKWWFAVVAHSPEEAASLLLDMTDPMESPMMKGQQAMEARQGTSPPQTRSYFTMQTKREEYERPKSMEINFVQVCRDYFRSESFLEQSYLEHLYNSATAVFVYPNCAAIDMVGAIKVESKSGELTYHPLLVSVKNWGSMSDGQANSAIESMRQFVAKMRAKEGSSKESQTPKVLCILLTLGCQPTPTDYTWKEIESFPCDDTFRCVSVPENDTYGISTAVASMGGTVESSEILSSHSYLAGLKSSKGCLRSKSKQRDSLETMRKKLCFEQPEQGPG